MSGQVPFFRPELPSFSEMLSGRPVSATDWGQLAGAVNWLRGRGGQCLPYHAVGYDIPNGGSDSLVYRWRWKRETVARVWCLNMLSGTDGATATVTINGNAYAAVTPPTDRGARRNSYVFLESLSAQSNSIGTSTVTVAASGGTITVEGVSCWGHARFNLETDATDGGVDLTTCRARQPIVYFDYTGPSGVCVAEQGINARRMGHFAWTVPTTGAITPGSTTLTSIFDLDPVVQPACEFIGDTQAALQVRVYSKVDTGTGKVRFASAQAADTTTISITSTSYSWMTAELNAKCEDLTIEDGRRGNVWESIEISAADPTGGTLRIQSIQINRQTTATQSKL